jgi:hypothetical protein
VGVKISARELNRSTLDRQLLLRRESCPVEDAVRRVGALQAQHPAGPYVALWNRVADFDPTDMDSAFSTQSIVRATLMRITLHPVHAADYAIFREGIEPTLRAARLNDRVTASGLTVSDADALVPPLLTFANRPRTGDECEAWLERRLGYAPGPGAWWGLRQYAPLLHVPDGSPWSFGSPRSYVAAKPRPKLGERSSERGLQHLVVRYLEGFGPASIADVAAFAMVQRSRVKAAVKALGDDLEQLEGPSGEILYDVALAPRPVEDTPAPPRLMAMWDSVLLAHADRSRLIPPAYRAYVTRSNGDVLPSVLVDGYVAGVWRAVDGGIDVTAFRRLPADVWDALGEEAVGLSRLLADRETTAYRRYDHWWAKLSGAQVRILPSV